MDDYQRRYLEHRKRKAEMIELPAGDAPLLPNCEHLTDYAHQCKAWNGRRSIRQFRDMPIYPGTIVYIMRAARAAPQSCNRQALKLVRVTGQDVGELLAGGEGWVKAAPEVILIFADMAAYRSPVETEFMPWLDAGVMLATIVYVASADALGSCIINPHVRPERVAEFRAKFNPKAHLFCGAVALGYAAITPECPEKKPMEELAEW